MRYPLALVYVCLSVVAGIWGASVGFPGWLPVVGLPVVVIAGRRGGPQLAVIVFSCLLAIGAGDWRYMRTAYHDGPGEVGHYVGHGVVLTGVVDGEAQSAG